MYIQQNTNYSGYTYRRQSLGFGYVSVIFSFFWRWGGVRPCDERHSIEREGLDTCLGESSSAVNQAPKTKRSCLKIHL